MITFLIYLISVIGGCAIGSTIAGFTGVLIALGIVHLLWLLYFVGGAAILGDCIEVIADIID